MSLVNVINCCLDSIRQISDELKGAVVYLDSGCTESFKYLGAFPLLLELGAIAVRSLEDLTSLDAVVDWSPRSDSGRKLVVFTARLLSDAHRYVLRCLSTNQRACRCTIFTSISETAHSAFPDSPLGPDAFHEYETLLVQDYEELMKRSAVSSPPYHSEFGENSTTEDEGWSQITPREEDITNFNTISNQKEAYKDAQKLTVLVHHFPLMVCPFSPRVFVLPSEGSVSVAHLSGQHENSISPGLPPLSTGVSFDGEEMPPGAMLTAQFLYHLTTKMDLKLEIFSLGDLSKVIGKQLTDMSSLYDVGRQKRSAGLLLIDRTFDLLTPCCHGDSLMDRIFSSLPRRSCIASSNQQKIHQTRLNHVKRSPLDLQIPLPNIFGEEDLSSKNCPLLESIEAFLHGWNSDDPASDGVRPIGDLGLSLESELLSGSLVSTLGFHGTPYLESLLDRRTKDGSILIKKWLQETLLKENISINAKPELQLMIKTLAKSQSTLVRNRGIIQLAAATLYVMAEKHSARWDAFISAEKILHASAGDTSQSLAAQMSDIIHKSSVMSSQGEKIGKTGSVSALLSFQDALLLTVTGYILAGESFPTSGSAGPFSWQEEHFLKEAIVDAILENPEEAKLRFLHGLGEDLEAQLKRNKEKETAESSNILESDDFGEQWGSWGDEDEGNDASHDRVYNDMQLKLELRDRVDNFFKFLHKLSCFKGNMQLREGTLGWESNMNDPYSSKGLLYRLLTRLLSKHNVPGLEYHSSTVGRLFKSGFGRFGLGQAKPSISDQDVIIVFVLGGINAVEVLEAQEAIAESSRPDIELVLGGTTLLTPNDMFDLLLGESSYI